ncbi:11361_t:CDS:2 [Funneliformis caledonium]|uniref:11361_t:CDS:1 n=1 Tax=Funneliformis caledonium TaxID=1117310 RepID=A0A9N9H8B6_9GLOM|nr:11361_t:CDS:2 [Funneliformis caledonium]
MNQREKFQESDNPKHLVQRINLTSSRPPFVQRINLTDFRPPSASSLQKSNLTASSNHLTSFSPFSSAFSASFKSFSASSTQKLSINLEKLEAIKGRYGIRLPSRYEKDVVTEASEKGKNIGKKLPAMIWIYQDNYQNLAKKLSNLRMKYNQEDNEILTGVNLDFSNENDELKNKNAELKKAFSQSQSSKKGKKPLCHADDKNYELSKSSSLMEESEETKARPINNIDYNETFNSERNIRILSKLILELQRALRSHFRPSVGQLTKWLNSLHKSCCSQSKLKSTRRITKDNHHVYNNGQIQDKRLRQVKAAKDLYKKGYEQIMKYEKRELLLNLANRLYHSPEISEDDEEDLSKPSSVFMITHAYIEQKDMAFNTERN